MKPLERIKQWFTRGKGTIAKAHAKIWLGTRKVLGSLWQWARERFTREKMISLGKKLLGAISSVWRVAKKVFLILFSCLAWFFGEKLGDGDKKKFLRRDKKNGFKKMAAVVVILTVLILPGSFLVGYSAASLIFPLDTIKIAVGFFVFLIIGKSWVERGMPWCANQMTFEVPTAHFAVRKLFGERKRGYLLEGGPYFKWPDFIETTEHASLELDKISVEAKPVTHDDLGVVIEGSLQFRPDPEAVNEDGQVIYFEMSEDIIASGITDTLRAKLGGLGGIQTGEDLRRRRQSVEEVINHILRTETPIHLQHIKSCGIEAGDVFVPCDCRWKEVDQIEAADILDFYTAHWQIAKFKTDTEKQAADERSKIESRYGIDIEFFALSEVRFSPETMKALEALKQAGAREKTNELVAQGAERFKRLGDDVSSEFAIDVSHAIIDPEIARRRRTISGFGRGARPIFVINDSESSSGSNRGQFPKNSGNTIDNSQEKGKKGGKK